MRNNVTTNILHNENKFETRQLNLDYKNDFSFRWMSIFCAFKMLIANIITA